MGSSRSDNVERGKVELVDSIVDVDSYELDVYEFIDELFEVVRIADCGERR